MTVRSRWLQGSRGSIPVLEATGLRIGEVLGLQWDDLDLDSGQLEIRRAFHTLTPARRTRVWFLSL